VRKNKIMLMLLTLLTTMLLVVGCGGEDKAKYTVGEDSKLTKEDMSILQKDYKKLTDDEKKRLDDMMAYIMTEEELVKFKDDLEKYYIERYRDLGGLEQNSAKGLFEEDFNKRLWQVRNPDKPLKYRGL